MAGPSRRFRPSSDACAICGRDEIVRCFFHLHRVLLGSDKGYPRQTCPIERNDADGGIDIEENRSLLSVCALHPRSHFASLEKIWCQCRFLWVPVFAGGSCWNVLPNLIQGGVAAFPGSPRCGSGPPGPP